MNDSILYEGDYGIGDTRARDARLKAESGHSGLNGKNGYNFHGSMNTKGISDLLREWQLFPQYHRSRSW